MLVLVQVFVRVESKTNPLALQLLLLGQQWRSSGRLVLSRVVIHCSSSLTAVAVRVV